MPRMLSHSLLFLAFLFVSAPQARAAQESNGLSGHLGVGLKGVAAPYQYGMSFYSSVFTLNPEPAKGIGIGAGTWIVPDNFDFTQPLCPVGTVARDNWPERGPTYRDVYQTLEGGVGQWPSTHFPSSSPKSCISS